MNTLIWASKSIYKMLIIFMLMEIIHIKQDWWYDTVLIVGVMVSILSSIPYSGKK